VIHTYLFHLSKRDSFGIFEVSKLKIWFTIKIPLTFEDLMHIIFLKQKEWDNKLFYYF